MLSVHDLTKAFGGFIAVNRVSFDVAEGEILGLIGPNGSGKSTTFNLIAGALAPSAGSIRLREREIGGLYANRVAHLGVGRTYQIPRPFRKLSLVENVALAAYYGQAGQPSRERAYQQARDALELVKLPSEDAARVDGLGAAGLKKLELARALATQPQLLLADESLGGLDEQEMNQAADMLSGIRDRRGITIIWVEHIMGALMRVVDRCVVLDHGEVIAQGKPQEVAHDPKVIEVYLGTDARQLQSDIAARTG
ncbi:MAG: ABC transporter ATP-binding protein [Betaproteobacteria bacterium]|nr:ABC transporter ATP-binding protein [Betaproteobacteria bacterium]